MMKTWLLWLLLAAVWIFQVTIVRSITLLSGAADVMMLFLIAWILQPETGWTGWAAALTAAVLADLTSAMPTGAYFVFYLLAAALAWWVRQRLWQSQIVAMLLIITASVLTGYTVFFVLLWVFRGVAADIRLILAQIIFPSLFLDLLWAFPVFYTMRDLAQWAYAEERT